MPDVPLVPFAESSIHGPSRINISLTLKKSKRDVQVVFGRFSRSVWLRLTIRTYRALLVEQKVTDLLVSITGNRKQQS